MRQKVFRLTEDQIERLKAYALEHEKTESDVIREAIDNISRDTQPIDTGNGELVAELRRHIDSLERETERLSAALEAAQEATRAAQALHASEKGLPAALAPKEAHMSRWKRLRAAWRG